MSVVLAILLLHTGPLLVQGEPPTEHRPEAVSTSPPSTASEAIRFPSPEVVEAALEFNQAYRTWIRDQQRWYPLRYEEWQEVYLEATEMRRPWFHLQQSRRCPQHDETDHLEILRGLIGEDNWWVGRMPPYVPVWRFREIP